MFRRLFIGLLFASAAFASACSSGTVVLTKPSGGSTTAFLPSAFATGCIGPSASSQTTPLPSAGGVTGTVTVGPVTAGASSCAITVEVATGADATLNPAAVARLRGARSRLTTAAASPIPTPLLQVDLSTTPTTSTVTTVTFALPSSVPPGTYPVTVTGATFNGSENLDTITNYYTVTVSSNGTATLNVKILLGANTSGLLSIYPQGTVFPTPSPTPTPSPSPTQSPLPTTSPTSSATPLNPTPTPTSAPTLTPGPTPVPTPTITPTPSNNCLANMSVIQSCGSYVVNGYYDGPAGYYSPEPGPINSTPQPLYNQNLQGNPKGLVQLPYYWFVGSVTVTLNNYGGGQVQTPVNDCPSTVTLDQTGTNGDTYTLYFPANGAQGNLGSNGAGCGIYIEVPNELESGGSYYLQFVYPGGTVSQFRKAFAPHR